MTTLTFELSDPKAPCKLGKFEIDELNITGSGEDLEIEYDDIRLFLDGKRYDGTFSNWAGSSYDDADIFDQVLAAYLRNDTDDYQNFEGFEIFNQLEKLKEWEDNILIKFPVYSYGVRVYNLLLATPSNRYYWGDDYFLMLNSEGKIITDVECFFDSAYIEDICAILKGEQKCLYKSNNVDEFIKEHGGKEGFLREFDNK